MKRIQFCSNYQSFLWEKSRLNLNQKRKVVNNCLLKKKSLQNPSKKGNFYSLAKEFHREVQYKELHDFEMKLSTCIFRLDIIARISSGKQLIHHGLMLLNGQVVNFPNILLQSGDLISVTAIRKNFIRLQKLSKRNPIHIESNYNILDFIILFKPQQIYYPSISIVSNLNKL